MQASVMLLQQSSKCKKFSYRFTSLRKLNKMAVLSFFIPKLNSIQTLVWPVLYVYHVTGSLLTSPAAPLLIRLTTQQTDCQYSYYAKNIKGCLSSKKVYIEHDIHLLVYVLVQYLKYSHKKLFSTPTGKQY